ncbi:MAG: hypothetical protein Q8Q97_02105 [bacterium]|nr:hypothetical protein [bacterium]
MWQNWLNGILGLWIILMPFLGLTAGMHRTLMIVTGVVIAVLGFWSASSSNGGAM